MTIKRIIPSIIKETIGFLFLTFGGVYLVKKSSKRRAILVVLNYHSFSKYNNYKTKRGNILKTGYASNFEKQIHFLKKHFSFSYPEDFFGNKSENRIQVLLTFDDGYKDNYDIAFPIIKKHKAKSIFFIVTDIIGTKEWLKHDQIRFLVNQGIKTELEIENLLKKMNQGQPIDNWLNENSSLLEFPDQRLMMNWEEVHQIAENGFKIGPHTHHHSILSFLNKKQQEEEIIKSIKTIYSKLNIQSNYFAFPNGLYNYDSLTILEENNINYSFTTQPGFNTQVCEPRLLKRIGINPSDSIGVLLLKLYLNRNK